MDGLVSGAEHYALPLAMLVALASSWIRRRRSGAANAADAGPGEVTATAADQPDAPPTGATRDAGLWRVAEALVREVFDLLRRRQKFKFIKHVMKLPPAEMDHDTRWFISTILEAQTAAAATRGSPARPAIAGRQRQRRQRRRRGRRRGRRQRARTQTPDQRDREERHVQDGTAVDGRADRVGTGAAAG